MSQDYFLDRTQGAGAIAAHAPAPRSAPAPMLRGRRALGAINQGFVETSNVNVTEELINMIQAQRAYEINSRSVRTSDEMLQKLASL